MRFSTAYFHRTELGTPAPHWPALPAPTDRASMGAGRGYPREVPLRLASRRGNPSWLPSRVRGLHQPVIIYRQRHAGGDDLRLKSIAVGVEFIEHTLDGLCRLRGVFGACYNRL